MGLPRRFAPRNDRILCLIFDLFSLPAAGRNFDIRISDFFLLYFIKIIIEVRGGSHEEKEL
jgi:hypothetical protein